MYGVKSDISDDWIPGIFSTLWAKANQRTNKYSSWITCDGPVDAIWIENLNTVLDDSRLLCLANGERIKLHSKMRVFFEVQNLEQASPATISRCGMVYVSRQTLNSSDLIFSYFQSVDLNPKIVQFFTD
jgi:dynein heavy chain